MASGLDQCTALQSRARPADRSAHIIETGMESYRFRKRCGRNEKCDPRRSRRRVPLPLRPTGFAPAEREHFPLNLQRSGGWARLNCRSGPNQVAKSICSPVRPAASAYPPHAQDQHEACAGLASRPIMLRSAWFSVAWPVFPCANVDYRQQSNWHYRASDGSYAPGAAPRRHPQQ